METDLICNHRANAGVECVLAGAEGWLLAALTGGVAAFTCGLVLTGNRMEMDQHHVIFQPLDLSLVVLELLNLLLQFLNMYKRR